MSPRKSNNLEIAIGFARDDDIAVHSVLPEKGVQATRAGGHQTDSVLSDIRILPANHVAVPIQLAATFTSMQIVPSPGTDAVIEEDLFH